MPPDPAPGQAAPDRTAPDRIDRDQADRERRIEERLQRWIRARYYNSLKEEISTDIIQWIRNRYSIMAALVGMATLFGLGTYFSITLEQLAEDKIDEIAQKYEAITFNRMVDVQGTLAELKIESEALGKEGEALRAALEDNRSISKINRVRAENLRITLDETETQAMITHARLLDQIAEFEGKADNLLQRVEDIAVDLKRVDARLLDINESNAMLYNASMERIESELLLYQARKPL